MAFFFYFCTTSGGFVYCSARHRTNKRNETTSPFFQRLYVFGGSLAETDVTNLFKPLYTKQQ
jgi:hypothetical protein